MKPILSALCFLSLLLLPNPAAAAGKKVPFYRHPAPNRLPPHLPGDPAVVNAASFEPGISPGGLATIFGTNLTSVDGTVVASALPLPIELAGVSVLVNGINAAMYSVAFANGQDQISFQVPFETATGPNAAEVQVFDGGAETADFFTDSFTEDPGIFAYNGSTALAVHPDDSSLVNDGNPAGHGEILVLYTTGLGPVNVPVPDGAPGPTDPLASTIDPFEVLLNGENCEVLFSGLAPGFAGVYQLNFRVPDDAAVGDLDLEIQSPYASSRVETLAVGDFSRNSAKGKK